MTRIFLLPGDLVCDAFGMPPQSDHRQSLRTFFNTLIRGAVATDVALQIAL